MSKEANVGSHKGLHICYVYISTFIHDCLIKWILNVYYGLGK